MKYLRGENQKLLIEVLWEFIMRLWYCTHLGDSQALAEVCPWWISNNTIQCYIVLRMSSSMVAKMLTLTILFTYLDKKK